MIYTIIKIYTIEEKVCYNTNGDTMNEENKQYILNGIAWINIILLTPVLFLTIIFNAQTAVYQFRTGQTERFLLLYGVQVLILLFLFLPAVLLQVKRGEQYQSKALFLLTCESGILFLLSLIDFLFTHFQFHLYGGVFDLFLHSYIGVTAMFVNAVFGICLFKMKGVQLPRFKMVNCIAILFTCLSISMYLLR